MREGAAKRVPRFNAGRFVIFRRVRPSSDYQTFVYGRRNHRSTRRHALTHAVKAGGPRSFPLLCGGEGLFRDFRFSMTLACVLCGSCEFSFSRLSNSSSSGLSSTVRAGFRHSIVFRNGLCHVRRVNAFILHRGNFKYGFQPFKGPHGCAHVDLLLQVSVVKVCHRLVARFRL